MTYMSRILELRQMQSDQWKNSLRACVLTWRIKFYTYFIYFEGVNQTTKKLHDYNHFNPCIWGKEIYKVWKCPKTLYFCLRWTLQINFLICFRFFLSEMSSSIESEAIDSITQWAAVTHVLTIIKECECFWFWFDFMFWLFLLDIRIIGNTLF